MPAAGALWVCSAPREGGGPLHLCAGEEAACGYWSVPEEDLKVEEAEPSAVLVFPELPERRARPRAPRVLSPEG